MGCWRRTLRRQLVRACSSSIGVGTDQKQWPLFSAAWPPGFDEGQESTRLGRSLASPWMAASGHEGKAPPPRPSDRCSCEATFAGASSSDADAPISAIRGAAIEPQESTLMRHSRPRRRITGSARNQTFTPKFCTRRPPGSPQLVEQRLCLFEVGRIETLGEPVVDRCEKVMGVGAATLVAAEPGEARGGAQFPELGVLPGRC
jgi:hypothetical protein